MKREVRRLVVDGVEYGYSHTTGGFVSVWIAGNKRGASLRACFGIVGYGGFGLLPNHAAKLVRYGLANGWTPEHNGPPWLLQPSPEAQQLLDGSGPIEWIIGGWPDRTQLYSAEIERSDAFVKRFELEPRDGMLRSERLVVLPAEGFTVLARTVEDLMPVLRFAAPNVGEVAAGWGIPRVMQSLTPTEQEMFRHDNRFPDLVRVGTYVWVSASEPRIETTSSPAVWTTLTSSSVIVRSP